MLLVAAGTALALMVLVVVTTAKRPPVLQRPDRNPNLHITYGRFRAPTVPGGSLAPATRNPRQQGAEAFSTVILDIVLALALAVIVLLIVAIAMSLVRRWRHRLKVRREGPLPDVDDAVLDAVSEVTQRQQQQLLEGRPSNAIVACWVDLERAVGAAGVERRPSETSAELTIRMLDALDVDLRALRTLGALYREARFSAHPLTEDDRRSAVDALAALHRSLPAAQQEKV
jgi:hypothetical protein